MMNQRQTYFRFLPLVAMLGLFASCHSQIELAQLDFKSQTSTGSFIINNYCTSSNRNYVDFFVLLRSVRIRGGQVLTNWARDGIPDVDKQTLGLNIFSSDQSNSGYGNLVLYNAGIQVSQFGSVPKCSYASITSIPSYFLNDCDRNFLQLKMSIESVARAIPDDLAVWSRLDLQDPGIASRNPTGDGISNLVKVKMNAPIDETMSASTQALAPIYSIQQVPNATGSCFTFRVSNIQLVDVSNGNEVDAYILSSDSNGQLSEKVTNILFTPLNWNNTMELDYDAL